MSYRSRLQRIQERRSLSRAILMFGLGITVLIVLAVYGVKGMAYLAILMDKIKFGDVGMDVTDKIPPIPPTLWADYSATNSAQINIYVLSEPNIKLFLVRNGEEIESKSSSDDGKVVFDKVELKSGINTFWAKATDLAGNTSHQSKNLEIVYSDKLPSLELDKPSDGQVFGVQDNPIEIKGKSEPLSKVYVNNRLVTADKDGIFSIKIKLNEGENNLDFIIINTTGNQITKNVKVTFQP